MSRTKKLHEWSRGLYNYVNHFQIEKKKQYLNVTFFLFNSIKTLSLYF